MSRWLDYGNGLVTTQIEDTFGLETFWFLALWPEITGRVLVVKVFTKMALSAPRIAFIASGAGGMYCGSCLRDNALAAALQRSGVDIQLIPTYTPIRTDEDNVSMDRVFFGGIGVYLRHRLPWFRYVPRAVDRWLDRPALLRWASQRSTSTDASRLGPLTESMLEGVSGAQKGAVQQFVNWLAGEGKPDIINFSNMLMTGCVPALKQALHVPILVTLQGDDIFLTGLQEPYRTRVIQRLRELVQHVDGFIVFSQFYADRMSELLSIPPAKMHIVPLGISMDGFPQESSSKKEGPLTIGYLARVCFFKGLHHLVEAFLELRQLSGLEDTRLRIAGWLGSDDVAYFQSQQKRLKEAGAEEAFSYEGVLERAQKIDFLKSVDVLSVPSVYEEPKGLYVLEALACGTPVVQPRHGAFPELLGAAGGRLFDTQNLQNSLVQELATVLLDHELRGRLGREGQTYVHQHRDASTMAAATLDVYRQYLTGDSSASY